jgi:hypothetical protein
MQDGPGEYCSSMNSLRRFQPVLRILKFPIHKCRCFELGLLWTYDTWWRFDFLVSGWLQIAPSDVARMEWSLACAYTCS